MNLGQDQNLGVFGHTGFLIFGSPNDLLDPSFDSKRSAEPAAAHFTLLTGFRLVALGELPAGEAVSVVLCAGRNPRKKELHSRGSSAC